jgi:hypothetical protein
MNDPDSRWTAYRKLPLYPAFLRGYQTMRATLEHFRFSRLGPGGMVALASTAHAYRRKYDGAVLADLAVWSAASARAAARAGPSP